MKNKIKKMAYAAAGAGLTLPFAALAQFEPPSTGDTGTANTPVMDIAYAIMRGLLFLVGIIGIIGFVIAGIMYLVAAGDEDTIKRAKKAMLNSIIGIVVALIGLVVMTAISNIIAGNESF